MWRARLARACAGSRLGPDPAHRHNRRTGPVRLALALAHRPDPPDPPFRCMTESDLRDVLLMRATEQAAAASPPDARLAVDLAADLDWAGAEARRRLGAAAAPQDWLTLRARLGLARRAERGAAWLPGAGALPAVSKPLSLALLALTLGLGVASDGLGAGRQINLLALPMLGLLAWNLLVYAGLLALALRSAGLGRPTRRPLGPLRHALLALAASAHGRLSRLAAPALAAGPAEPAAVLRFQRDWLAASLPLQSARLAALLHAAAAALALGLLLSLYARGLVLDYRAGWDSTFLDANAVRALLGGLLGPAAAISQQALPDAQALAALRLASGGGEGAARWIHLWALTLTAAVVMPRLALAAAAGLRARRRAADLPWPAGLTDLQPVLASAGQARRPVLVLAYSYALDGPRQARLRALLADQGQTATLLPSLPLGAEDLPTLGLPADHPPELIALFALTATPEAESHGAFLRALAARLPAGGRLGVLVDESGFRQRFGGAAGQQRLGQRRDAWAACVAAALPAGAAGPQFIDLAAVSGTGAAP